MKLYEITIKLGDFSEQVGFLKGNKLIEIKKSELRKSFMKLMSYVYKIDIPVYTNLIAGDTYFISSDDMEDTVRKISREEGYADPDDIVFFIEYKDQTREAMLGGLHE